MSSKKGKKMKRSIFSRIIVILVMIVTLGFVGCKNETADNFEVDSYSQSIIDSYSNVGKEHNIMLNDFFSTFDFNPRTVLNDDLYRKKFEDYFGTDVKVSEFSGFYPRSNIEYDTNIDNAIVYVNRIDSLLDSELISTEDFAREVTLIEVEAIANLSDEELQPFMCYAEVAKASCEFWNDNTCVISPRSGLGKKIKACVASDALGALFGAAAASIIILKDPFFNAVVTSNPPAFAIMISLSAVICSAASSAEGYRTGMNVYAIPEDKVLSSLKSKKY